jgi:hypothetical protein
MEICGLNELGYPLAPTQGELTLLQKSFLFHAYPVFNERQRELAESNQGNSDSSSADRDAWKKRYSQMRERKLKQQN